MKQWKVRVHFLSRTTWKKERNMQVKICYANFSSIMLFRCDICKDKSLMLHLPTTLTDRSSGKQLVQESYSISIIALCVMAWVSTHHFVQELKYYPWWFQAGSPKDLTFVPTESLQLLQIRVADYKKKEKWLKEQFNILTLAHLILLMNIGLLPKSINLNLCPFFTMKVICLQRWRSAFSLLTVRLKEWKRKLGDAFIKAW